MTREDAKDKIIEIAHSETTTWDANSFIDEIYDDFESRTCENCKLDNDLDCPLLFIQHEKPSGVSCDKWEAKDD